MTAPNRRWPRYTLRTLFVVVLIAGIAAYQFHWIAQRDECLKLFERTGCGPASLTPGDAPWPIRIFGAYGYSLIGVAKNSDEQWTAADRAVLEQVRRLFPEAQVYELSYEVWQATAPHLWPPEPGTGAH